MPNQGSGTGLGLVVLRCQARAANVGLVAGPAWYQGTRACPGSRYTQDQAGVAWALGGVRIGSTRAQLAWQDSWALVLPILSGLAWHQSDHSIGTCVLAWCKPKDGTRPGCLVLEQSIH